MNTLFIESALLWIVLLPLAGAIINGLFGRSANRGLVAAVGVGTVGVSFGLAVVSFIGLANLRGTTGNEEATIVSHLFEWFTFSFGPIDIPVNVSFTLDGLSGLMLLVVTGVGFLIHLYSLEYMEDDEGFARFFAYLNLFMAAMLILVLGSSLPVMFVGWEGVGLCSYLLIGFWFKTPEYAAAGRKAFIVNRIGDFGVLIGMFILFAATNTFEFSEMADRTGALTAPLYFGRTEIGMTATVACLFIFLGCTGKSAQIPLFTWLPDAMAGPTPVSALIHAATMVTAGVYLCCRMSDVFILSPTAMAVVTVVGALTALLAASIALVQNQMKRILAYSTVSQLGFMFAAVGAGAFTAGIFHVFTHAFFKACLFLGAGAVMHAVHAHGDADIRKLGGLKSKLTTIHWTFLLSCLAIAGFPLTAGFFSKDEILLGALVSGGYFETGLDMPWLGWLVFGILVVAATMTAFYMFRMYFLVFWGSYRSGPRSAEGEAEEHAHDQVTEHGYAAHPHPPGLRIAGPLMALGIGAVLAGWLNWEPIGHLLHVETWNLWGEWLEPSLAAVHGETESVALYAFAGGTLAWVVGIGLAYVLYVKQGRMPATAPGFFHRVLLNKWYVDELYAATVVRFVGMLARFSASADKYFVDGIIARFPAAFFQAAGWVFTRIQTGVVYGYAAVMVLGLLLLGWWFTYPHPSLTGVAQEQQVEWAAGRGLGYEYRWDLNDDGDFEHDWDAGRYSVTHAYVEEDWTGLALVLAGRGILAVDDERVLDPTGEELTISSGDLGEGWEAPEGDGAPPVFRARDGKVLLQPNGALATVRGVAATEETELSVGDVVQVGDATVHVAAVVRTTVEVRSAFGNVIPQTVEIVIQPRAGATRQVALGPPLGGGQAEPPHGAVGGAR